MSDINILRDMIKTVATIPVSGGQNSNNVTLTEPTQPKISVTIGGLPKNVIVIKADCFRSPDTVFQGSKGECKRADFVIIAHTANEGVVLYIEMKAGSKPESEIIKQLKGAQCFVAYCREIGREFWNEQDFLGKYMQRFVSISHVSIPKKSTRIMSPKGIHDRPDKMLKIVSPSYLEFSRLAGA